MRILMLPIAIGATMIALAPSAYADYQLDSVSVSAPVGNYGTGCTYTLTATGMYAYYTRFWDNGVPLPDDAKVNGSTVTQSWKPTTTGPHTLVAHVNGDPTDKTIVTTVSNGLNLGSTCIGL
ncbi:hypothetical protein VMT65_04795 [Nocardia sp. CDC153]|uniref:hypothetical protein n=1 Tax=Nocardia sp. CDC153 TaxID=3112167 RepID=UPI002DB9F776|nr:hypothetical protein [Nocardia sp. CDC153]MEC3952347.1 hypothetical protein [Nocardia sp. CDC153]